MSSSKVARNSLNLDRGDAGAFFGSGVLDGDLDGTSRNGVGAFRVGFSRGGEKWSSLI